MKKRVLFIIGIFLILPLISAIDLKVENIGDNGAMIVGLPHPVKADLKVTNNGRTDDFKFYNLLGFEIEPNTSVVINEDETKTIFLIVYPRGGIKYRGEYTLPYFIKGSDGSEVEERVTFDLINLGDAFEIGAEDFNPESNSLNIYILNKENYDFTNINMKLSSAFFKLDKNLSISPYERKIINVNLNKEDFKKLMAGFYTLKADILMEDQKAETEGLIKFIEKNIVTTTSNDYGLIISTKTIKKVNEGNVLDTAHLTVKKNIISRLFTTFSPEPDSVERDGATVYYSWQRDVKPGEELEIIVKTNWLFPFLIIILLIVIIALTRLYSKTDIVLKKKVSFVNAKGGEFALKVSILVRSRKNVDNVSIVDRLPPLVKLYERFGPEKPARADEKTRRIEWNFNTLAEGESRVISYIIYSKLGIFGKFALPRATAIYEKDGKVKEVESNQTFFVAEQRTKDLED